MVSLVKEENVSNVHLLDLDLDLLIRMKSFLCLPSSWMKQRITWIRITVVVFTTSMTISEENVVPSENCVKETFV